MHLKVCANPGCGKVSDASAAVCATCGVPFPPIKLVDPGSLGMDASANAAPAYAEASEKPRTSVWPLIAVAVVAGSLPLLWANRAHLPAPKSGPFSTPDITTPAPAPAPAASPAPPKVAAPAAVPVPPPAVPTAAAAASSAGELDPAGPAATAAPAKTEKKSPPRKPKSTVAQKSAKTPSKKVEPPPTCTEAVAALGLCDPKQVGK